MADGQELLAHRLLHRKLENDNNQCERLAFGQPDTSRTKSHTHTYKSRTEDLVIFLFHFMRIGDVYTP